MTGEGGGSRRIGAAGRSGGAESRRCAGHVPFAGAKLRNPPRFHRRPPAFFLHRRAVVRCAPRPLFPPRLRRSKSCAFSVSVPQFFRRSPALFSFGGWVAPSAEVKCAVPRACVSRPRQPLFVFSLHRFTPPHNTLTICTLRVKTLHFPLHLDRHFRTAVGAVGSRRNGRGAKLANSC